MTGYLLEYFYRTGTHTFDSSRKIPPNEFADNQGILLVYGSNVDEAFQILRNHLIRLGWDDYENTKWETKPETITIINKTIS